MKLSVFEVVDASQEGYQTLGTFDALEEAKKAIAEVVAETGGPMLPGIEIFDDEVAIWIIEKGKGWSGCKCVFVQIWERSFENESQREVEKWTLIETS